MGWTSDATSLFVARRGEQPVKLHHVEVASGQKQLWKTVMPRDPAGVGGITSLFVTPDGRLVVYSCEQTLSERYLVEGLKSVLRT